MLEKILDFLKNKYFLGVSALVILILVGTSVMNYYKEKANEAEFKKFVEVNEEFSLEELDAEQNNCQIIWVKSKIIYSNYKIFGELKFRDKESRNIDKRHKCLKRIGKILQNKFNVFIRLRAFSIQDASITALDLEN